MSTSAHTSNPTSISTNSSGTTPKNSSRNIILCFDGTGNKFGEVCNVDLRALSGTDSNHYLGSTTAFISVYSSMV